MQKNSSSLQQGKIKLLLLVFLSIFVLVEGSYIYLLQDKVRKRNEELKNISVQLQHLKQEREDLKIQLSQVKKTGDDHGNTFNR